MVNIGRPSQGCFTCKERRVKCSLEKPYCQRCTTSKRKCAGYPDIWELMHRQQNASAKKQVQARVQRKTGERMLEQATRASAVIPRSIHIGVEVYSLNRFYADYSTNSGIAFFSVLPELYDQSSEMCYQEAMHAVALASSSRQLCQPGLMMQARRHYGRAITELNIGLRDSVRAGDDSLLVTLFLFGLFETIVAEQSPGKMNPDANCHPHSRGGLVLLRYRAEKRLCTHLDRSLFKFFSHIALMELFINRRSHAPLWSDLEKFKVSWTSGPILEPVLRRAVDFKMRIQATTATPYHQLPTADILQLIRSGIDISEELEATAALIGLFGNLPDGSARTQTVFNGLLMLSTETTEAIARTLYRCVRFHIVEMVLDLLSRLNSRCDNTNTDFTSLSDLHNCASILEQICEDIQNVFQPSGTQNPNESQPGIAYRAICMFWPMLLVLTSSFAGDDKKLWAIRKLQHIGEVSGLGLAVTAAGGGF